LTLPNDLDGQVVGLAFDDRFMMAVKTDRELWQMNWGLSENYTDFEWNLFRGLPFMMGPKNYLPEGAVKWDVSVISPEEDEYYIDPAGNQFPAGDQTCNHMVVLKEGGRWIAFNDSWLPADFNYEICGPVRGRFKSVNISTSGSTFFVMNKYGDMFTRLWDFDMGALNPFFEYAFEDQFGQSNPKRQLPGHPWIKQPKIEGTITDLISMHKVGSGATQRTLRVEGVDQNGLFGFYEKDIQSQNSADWVFRRTNRPLVGNILDNRPYDSSQEDLEEAEDFYFEKNIENLSLLSDEFSGLLDESEWAAELVDFNCYCSPAVLRIHTSASTNISLRLQHVHKERLEIRQTRGLSSEEWVFAGVIEVGQDILNNLENQNEKVQAFIEQYLDNNQFNWVDIKATDQRVLVEIRWNNASWEFSN
jgi:hypothetical protein